MITNESEGLNLRRVHPGFRQHDRLLLKRQPGPKSDRSR
jgi:hypothetical protein